MTDRAEEGVMHRTEQGARAWPAVVRWAAAAVFIAFGVGKFANHASELASFRHYGLPLAELSVYVIGGLEIVGGLLLAVGLLVRTSALLLAGDMVAAIILSGVERGEQISLTLAPIMLAAMCLLIWVGPGRWTLAMHPIGRLHRRAGRATG